MKKPIIIVLLCLACGLFSCTQTDSSTTTKDLTPNEIAEEIHTISRSGLRGNSEMLMKYVEMIDDHNVGWIVNTYMNTYNESFFGAIMHNVFISAKTRANASKHTKDMFIQLAKRDGVYTDDLDELMEKHIDYERDKFSRMDSKYIDRDLKYLTDRYNQTLLENILFSANGKIDEGFKQGYVNDCWLIAAIKSLSLKTKGLEMLDEILSLDDNGNVTVQLKGVDKYYTISKENIEGSNELAQGDLDVRALEIAINQYLHETGDHTNLFKRIKNTFKTGLLIQGTNYDLYGGMIDVRVPFQLLLGNEIEYDIGDIGPNEETIEKIKSGIYYTVAVVLNSEHKYNVDGFSKNHVYAVTSADDNNVFLSDPHNPDTTLTMTHDDFLKFFTFIYSTEY